MEITATIKLIKPTVTVGANNFSKRELILSTHEQYPQHIMIEFTQDKCDMLNNYRVGEQVKVSINLRGREWVNPQGETKYFNSIQGWRIEREAAANTSGQYQQAPAAKFEPVNQSNPIDDSDLPF